MKSTKYIFAAALAVLALGCNKEQVAVDGTPDGAEVAVTFTTELPGVATKAIGDGLTAKNLMVAVYENDAEKTHLSLDKTATLEGLHATVNFSLVKGKTYNFIFWAQADNAPYTFDTDAKKVAISYTDAVANDESRDAFYAIRTLTVTGAATETVQLHRPFAQVNFGTSDFEAAAAAGVAPVKSVFTTTEAATSFLPFEGKGEGSESVTFAAEAIPTEKLITKDGTEYTYLAMNYFIPSGDITSSKVSTLVTATFIDAKGQEVPVRVPSAKVQANWRTNIIGNLLTDQVTFNVEVVPAFEDDENIALNVVNAAALKAALAQGGIVKLEADITLGETVSVPAGKDVVLDLNGYKLNNTTDIWDYPTAADNNWSLLSVKGGKLTIKGNGTFTAKENDCYAVDVQDGGHVIIEDGEYVGNIHAVYVEEGTAEIRGGKYSVQQKYPDAAKADEFVLNCYDANRANGTAKIIVTGGEFVSFNPADCWAEGAHTNFLAPGYVSSKISDTPEIYKVAEAPTVVVKTAAELATMLTTLTSAGSGNNIVEVVEDIQLAEGETWVPVKVDGYHGAGVITVKGNGHTIKGINAPLFAGGFAGKSGIVVKDLTLENVAILDNGNLGVGAFVGSIDSMEKIELNNCHLLNSTITTTGDARTAGLIGWTSGYNNPDDGPVDTYITVRNCSVEGCTITAKGSVGAIIGHAGANPATYHTIENNVVKNCTLHSTDDGGWRVGVVVGTANVGEVTIKGTIESGNTLIQDGKTAPAGQSNLYGRFVPGTTGTLTINGVAVTL